MAAIPIFDLNYPKVWIESPLFADAFVDQVLIAFRQNNPLTFAGNQIE